MSDALTINNDDRLEQIAVEIETIQGVALLKVGERLVEAQSLFAYDRSEGGFRGWVDRRLRFSADTAYRLVNVFTAFGSESAALCDTLPKSLLYALAEPANKSISEEALAQIKSGKPLTDDDVAALKAKLKAAKAKAAEHKQQFEIERNSSEDTRNALRSATNEVLFLKQSIGTLKAEIERLKEDGVIHSYPAQADPEPVNVTPIRQPEPNRADCLRTAMDLIADRFDGDVGEVASLIRESGQFTVASELEAAAARRAEAA